MGLDMYLGVKNCGENEIREVGYWRKANAIHAWFERHNGGKLENCETMAVTKDMLLDLKRDCEIVLDRSQLVDGVVHNGDMMINGEWMPHMQEGKVIEDTSYAEELMPRSNGFFFGNQGYNQYYMADLEHTIDIVERVLNKTDFDQQQIYYMADW